MQVTHLLSCYLQFVMLLFTLSADHTLRFEPKVLVPHLL